MTWESRKQKRCFAFAHKKCASVTGSDNQYNPLNVHTGQVKVKVSAEALKTAVLCGNEVATVPKMGQIDTVVRTLLVEVSDPKTDLKHHCSLLIILLVVSKSDPISLRLFPHFVPF